MQSDFHKYAFPAGLAALGLAFASFIYPAAWRAGLAFESLMVFLLGIGVLALEVHLYKTGAAKQFRAQSAQDKLAQNKQRDVFRKIFDNLPFATFVFDQDKQLAAGNRQAEKFLNTGAGGISYPALREKLKKAADLGALYSSCLQNNQVVEQGNLRIGQNYYRLQLVPIQSRPLSGWVLAALFDETEAVAAGKSRDDFFAVASHELRTPLASIRGNLAVIKEYYRNDIKNAEIWKIIDQSHDSAVRLIKIVNDFLDVSRLEQGKAALSVSRVDVIQLISQVIEEMSYLATHKGNKLYFDRPDNLPEAAGDPSRLKQVIYNLLGNAINYTGNGSIRVSASEQGQNIRITVSDTGEGIPPGKQGLLFNKFQPAVSDYRTREPGGSTGMGLYISKLLMEAQGGSVGLEKSEPGRGSVFYITIPKAK